MREYACRDRHGYADEHVQKFWRARQILFHAGKKFSSGIKSANNIAKALQKTNVVMF